jgi:putative SOS response-associated peptidase YedK
MLLGEGYIMCGRYYLNLSIEDIMEIYGIRESIIEYEPKSEIYPSEKSVVITNNGKKEIKLFKWGFSSPYGKNLIINARSETIDIKPTFRESFLFRRCLIPANGFFEWEKKEGKSIKHRIHLKDDSIFSMAGIYSIFKDKHGNKYEAFTIITTSPNQLISKIHHRMPAIIDKKYEDLWLDSSVKDAKLLKGVLKPFNGNLVID